MMNDMIIFNKYNFENYKELFSITDKSASLYPLLGIFNENK